MLLISKYCTMYIVHVSKAWHNFQLIFGGVGIAILFIDIVTASTIICKIDIAHCTMHYCTCTMHYCILQNALLHMHNAHLHIAQCTIAYCTMLYCTWVGILLVHLLEGGVI